MGGFIDLFLKAVSWAFIQAAELQISTPIAFILNLYFPELYRLSMPSKL